MSCGTHVLLAADCADGVFTREVLTYGKSIAASRVEGYP